MPGSRKVELPRRTRRAHNLSLSDEAVARGKQYSAAVGLSLSRLVDEMLLALPEGKLSDQARLSPAVARLRRLLATEGPPIDWREEYREHFYQKYVVESDP